MSNMADSVNQALCDCQNIETSSFYRDYEKFSKEYDLLIKKGFTKRRESQLRTILDKNNDIPLAVFARRV